LVHVIPYMVEEYQFDQYRNCNGQNREIESWPSFIFYRSMFNLFGGILQGISFETRLYKICSHIFSTKNVLTKDSSAHRLLIFLFMSILSAWENMNIKEIVVNIHLLIADLWMKGLNFVIFLCG
jgi:hypothetical protein